MRRGGASIYPGKERGVTGDTTPGPSRLQVRGPQRVRSAEGSLRPPGGRCTETPGGGAGGLRPPGAGPAHSSCTGTRTCPGSSQRASCAGHGGAAWGSGSTAAAHRTRCRPPPWPPPRRGPGAAAPPRSLRGGRTDRRHHGDRPPPFLCAQLCMCAVGGGGGGARDTLRGTAAPMDG